MLTDFTLLAIAAFAGALGGTLAVPVVDKLYSDPLLYSPFGRCARCNTGLWPWGLIGLIGYARWLGHCPHCGIRFPLRMLLLPLASAVLVVLVLLAHDDSREIALTILFGSIGLLLITTDAERRLFPLRVMYPALALAIIAAPLWPDPSPLNLYLTGTALAAVFLLLRKVLNLPIGMAEATFAAMIGLTLGTPDAVIALGIAVMTALGAVILVFAESGPPARLLPYNSMLAVGMIFMLLWGEPLRRVF